MNEIGFYTNQAKMQFKCNHRKGLKVDSSGLLHCVANDRKEVDCHADKSARNDDKTPLVKKWILGFAMRSLCFASACKGAY